MDNMTFASYKFMPSNVIEGLNRYFAAKRYLKDETKSLEIRRGVCYNNPDCVKDIIFGNNPPKRATKTWCCWNYYLICDPEEVVGVAINWLREEHDIFYTPGMEVPFEDFDVTEAAKEYEKETRREVTRENLDMVSVTKVREALGIAEYESENERANGVQKALDREREKRRVKDISLDSDIFECIKYRNHQLDTLRTELAASRRKYHNSIEERNRFGRRLADIRKAAGMADGDPTDLVEYIKALREKSVENGVLRDNMVDYFADLAQGRQKALSNLRYEILKVYREIFDCSTGDPEGTDAETLQDILTEYKRTLELKNAAEEKTIKYKVRLDNAERQLRWTEEVSRERLEKCEDLTRERENVKRMEQKLNEIKDICER